jgi:hypothetical protein
MAGITVPIDGDLSPILKTFGELPGRTQEEMAAVGAVIDREARRGSIAKGFAEMEGVSAASAKRAANAVIREMERASRDSEKALGDLKKGATVVFGGVVGDIEDVVGALGAMGPAAVAAGAAVSVLAAGAAALWAEYKVVGMLYEFADATGKLSDEQAGLSAAIDETKKAIGDRFVPVFEGALIGVTAGTLAIRDFALKALDAGSAMLAWYQTLPTFARAMIGNVVPALQQADAINKLSEGLRTGTVDVGGYVAEARTLIGTLAATKAATDTAEKSTKKQASAHKAAAEAASAQGDAAGKAALAEIQYDQDLTDQILANIVAVDEARAKSAANYAAQLDAQAAADEERSRAGFEAEIARVQELQRARAQATQEYLFSGIAAAATLAQAVADSAEEGSAAQQAAAIAAFRLNQAGSIGTIAINTAEAITKAIALFGPPPSPAGVAGIAFASAIGLAQAAAVAAQAPPSFHTGGVIASNPLAPDETMIVARKGEEVRTRQEQGGGANVTVQMVYQHRIFDSFVMDNMRQAGSPLRREIQRASGRRVGHRSNV